MAMTLCEVPSSPVLLEPPEESPVSLVEVKQQLRIDHDDDNDKLTVLIEAATGYLDGVGMLGGVCLITQKWKVYASEFPTDTSGRLRLPFRPLQSVEALEYYDSSDALLTFSESSYRTGQDAISSYLASIGSGSWPSASVRGDAVAVTAVFGYGAAADVPAPIRQAIMMMVAHWYENREAVTVPIGNEPKELPLGFSSLIAPYRYFPI